MNIIIRENAKEIGKEAGAFIASEINKAVEKQGYARIVLSTGASQFETIEALLKEDVDWTKVTMFHLDEYVGLKESHNASFRKYLKERFCSHIQLAAAYFVNGDGDVEENIKELSRKLNEMPIDVGIIGIGENGHIAFNDPPADFETEEAYKVVYLDERCRAQQVGEHWFDTIEDVPLQAITMCPNQIMKCRTIVSVVPHKVKSEAVYNTLTSSVTNKIPATKLKEHKNWHLFLDNESASKSIKL